MTSLKTLAETNGLSFSPGIFFISQPKVEGSYQGHYVKIVITKNYDTHITVDSKQSSSQQVLLKSVELVEPAIITEWLTGVPDFEIKGTVTATQFGQKIYYKQFGIETDGAYLEVLLQRFSHLATAYSQVLALGGEIAPILYEVAIDNDHPLNLVAYQLLEDISHKTIQQIKERLASLLCVRCWARFQSHKLHFLSLQPATIEYYGCRYCKQSRQYYEGEGIIVLDERMSEVQVYTKNTFRVNWLANRRLFDFDRIEVIQVTDEDLERFAVQVGNDTDEIRRKRYKTIKCEIGLGCGISENSIRILRKMFGKVERR